MSLLGSIMRKALLVDSDGDRVERTRQALLAQGFTCTVSSDAGQSILNYEAGRYHLVVVGYETQWMDGISLIRVLRGVDESAYYLLLSRDVGIDFREFAKSCGGADEVFDHIGSAIDNGLLNRMDTAQGCALGHME